MKDELQKILLNIYVKWSNFVFKDGNLNFCRNEIFTQLMAKIWEKYSSYAVK